MPIRSRNNIGRKAVIAGSEKSKKKKETILIEVAKDQVIGEFVNGFEVIKPVKRYGKYYVLAKNK